MAYNLYHVQMAKAWCERVNKENALQERSQAAAALRGVRRRRTRADTAARRARGA